jgi:NAD(P)-dependent dehydrogenase (short-subunit alcohol dehydrogenase family)
MLRRSRSITPCRRAAGACEVQGWEMSARGADQSGEALAGRAAVVVGAAGGIGRAVAVRLAEAGCRLALVDREQAALQELALEDAVAVPTDITDRAQVERMAQEVERCLGGVHILVNSAGINTRERTLADLSAQQWERVIAVNLSGVFHCLQALRPLMQRTGAIVVNIASTAGRIASPGGGTHYCAAKRGLLSLTESINQEQGRNGIRACAISPGEVDTPLVDRRPQPPSPERRAAMLRPQDVADAVYYVVTRPPHVTVTELVIYPSAQISGLYVV